MTSVNEYGKWVKLGQELGLETTELRQFVMKRQAEQKAERDKEAALAEKIRQSEKEEKIRQDELAIAEKIRQSESEEKIKLAAIEAQRLKEEKELAEKIRQDELAKEIRQDKLAQAEKIRQTETDEKIRLAQIEAQKQENEAAEKRRADELAARARTEELQQQIKLKELELKLTRGERVGNGDTTQEQSHGGLTNSAKFLKMPIFHEDRDCLDAYLLRFERLCAAYGIPENQRALVLVRSLEGKALEVYQNMDVEESHDYEKLREALLKRFCLTEVGYRGKFKQCVREPDETVANFITRLQRYLRQWLQMSGLDNDHKGLETLIIKDQFFLRSDEDMRKFLKERGKLSLDEMIVQAQNFVESREFESKKWKPENKFKQKEVRVPQREIEHKKVEKPSEFSDQQKNSGFPNDRNWFKNKWDFKNQRKDSSNTERKFTGCYICNSKFHKASECKESEAAKKTHSVAAMITLEENFPRKINSLEGSDGKHGKSAETIKHNEGYCKEVLVNGIKANSLYDTGCTCTVVKAKYVRPGMYTGEEQSCRLVNGYRESYPVAMIQIESPEFTGETKAIVMPNLVRTLLLGPRLYSKGKAKVVVQSCEIAVQTEISDVMEKEDSLRVEERLDKVVVDEVLAVCETRSTETSYKVPKKLKCIDMPNMDVNAEELKKLQREDKTLGKFWKLAEESKGESESAYTGNPRVVVTKGILYRQCKEVLRDEIRYQLAVPQSLREKVIMMANESLLAAHQGVKRTLDKVMSEFFWPSMYGEVKRFVMSCNLCQRSSGVHGKFKAKLGHLPIVGIPFSVFCADLVGPIEPRSNNGYRYMLTMVDMATRYPEAFPLKGISAEEVAEAMFKCYCRVGIPQRIHTDRGSQFTSELMSEVNRLCQIEHSKSSPYHAMGNGVVERLNGSLKSTLRKLIVEQPKEWDRFLDPLLFALRDSVHESHGFSSFELVYGRSERGPMKILRELWTEEEVTEEVRDACSYMVDLQNRIEETCKIAQEELEKSQKKSERYYNKKARFRKLVVGDQVLMLTPVKASKMTFNWEGPYLVKDKVGEFDYRVEIAPGKIKTYHINMLKKYNTRKEVNDDEAVADESLAAIATVVNDGEVDEEEEILELYNGVQKESFLDVKVNPELDDKKKSEVRKLLEKYKDIFSDVPGRTNLAEHEIKLTSDTPARSKAYPTPYGLQKEIDKEIDMMLKSGVIERSEAAYAAPLVVVKKSDGSNRLCCNYMQLNKMTVFDPGPMMANEDIFVKLSGSKIFSKFDFCKGYWQIPMAEESKDYTTFICYG